MTFRRSDIQAQHASLNEEELPFTIQKDRQPQAKKMIKSTVPNGVGISDIASDNSLCVASQWPNYLQKPCLRLPSTFLVDSTPSNPTSTDKNWGKFCPVISKKNGDITQREKSLGQMKNLEGLETRCGAGCDCIGPESTTCNQPELDIQREQYMFSKSNRHQLLIHSLEKKCHKKLQNSVDDTNSRNKTRIPLVNEHLFANRDLHPSLNTHTNAQLEAGISEYEPEEIYENAQSKSPTTGLGRQTIPPPKCFETCTSRKKKSLVSKIHQNTHTNAQLEAGISEYEPDEIYENAQSESPTTGLGRQTIPPPKCFETCTSRKKKSLVSKIHQNTCQKHEKSYSDDSDSVRSQASDGKKKSTKNHPKIHASSSKKSTKCCKQCVPVPQMGLNHRDASTVSEIPVKSMQVCIPSDQLCDIFEYLKKQDEKLNFIQEQVALKNMTTCVQNAAYLTPNKDTRNVNEVASQSTATEVVPIYCNNGADNSQLIDVLKLYSEQNQILQVQNQKLQAQNQKLQEQMNMILTKVNGPNPAITNNTKFDTSPTHASKSVCLSSESNNEMQGTVEKVVCHKQTEVTKTSTSTMTSLICDGADKVIYQKLTVVTDVSKSTEKLSAHSAQKNDLVIPSEQSPKAKTPVSVGKCRRHSHSKCSPCCNFKKKHDSSPSPCSDRKTMSPYQGRRRSEKQANERNTNDVNTDHCNKEDRKSSSTKKKVPKSYSRKSRKLEKPETSPKEIDSSPVTERCQKRYVNRKKTSSRSSNASADSPPYPSDHEKYGSETDSDDSKVNENLSDSSTVSRYGISSPNLSIGTKKYLESYRLFGKKK